MTNREFFLAGHKAEYPAFMKVLKALPKDQAHYRPHPRSRSALELAWLIVGEEEAVTELIDTGQVDFAGTGHALAPPDSLEGVVEAYERQHAEVKGRLERLDETAWERKVPFIVAGQVLMEPRLGELLWHLYFDLLHHRGQLSVYIRPMGGQVRSIYGPSADDAGG